MKKAISFLLLLTGFAVLVTTAVFAFHFAQLPEVRSGQLTLAQERTQNWADAIGRGDYAAAGSLMYGQPELAPVRESDYEVGKILWDVCRDTMECTFRGECYATQSGIARDATITMLDVPAVMEKVGTSFNTLLTRRAEELGADAVLDENGAYREEFVMEVLCDSAEEVLRLHTFSLQREVTLKLLYENGQWWILPEQSLVALLSGDPGKGD